MDLHPIFKGERQENLWRLFSHLCTIAHRSHLHDPMCDFLSGYARNLGLETHIDKAHNVIVRKPASRGKEDAPPLILQAHYDMVCMAEPGVGFDFDSQPLDLLRDGDKVSAKGTTLGGDDGTNVAFLLDILSDQNTVHPALSAVFTADEEDGMDGALGLDCEALSGKLWINLDASPVKIGCFGSLRLALHVPKRTAPVKNAAACTITISGLLGGHSGNLATSERGNANVLLGRVLNALQKKMHYQLLGIEGGLYGGAFPTEACAKIAFDQKDQTVLDDVLQIIQKDLALEFSVRDPGVCIVCSPFMEAPLSAFSEDTKNTLLNLLLILPDGVFTMDHEYPDTAETTSNLGRIETRDEEIYLGVTIRSTIGAKKCFLRDKVTALCGLLGVSCEVTNEIPEWRGGINESMRTLLKKIYPDRPPVVCKGTMECGIFQQKLPDTQILALGLPFLLPHSPAEYILVSQTELFANRLREFIASVDWEHLGK